MAAQDILSAVSARMSCAPHSSFTGNEAGISHVISDPRRGSGRAAAGLNRHTIGALASTHPCSMERAMSEFVIYEKAGRVVTLTLNNPDERNAISSFESCDALVGALQRADSDPEVSVVILTGSGSAFCAGGNIKKMLDRENSIGISDNPANTRANYRKGIQQIPLALWGIEVPTIAAVNGPAIGAGCDLACMCDIRIASEKAKFAESFLKVGLVPGDGGAWFLPRVVGFSKAAEMTFTGDILGAAEALSCGLVSKVVAPEQLLDEARALAGRIAAQPPQALRLAKRLLRESHHQRL
ncbi:MAG: enoyl-CoA hydratase-related protein, partial [Spongiibacteraceae bacterium]|nr:enoyl-CoA hydratase-related protein [Spongiibacteraceae bacterium]